MGAMHLGSRMGLVAAALLGVVVAGEAPADAAPRAGQVHGGSSIVVRVRGMREKGLRLAHGEAGWSLTVDMPADGSLCAAELRDVTPLPTGLLKWTERLSNQETSARVLLTPDRYVGGHAYRMTVRCGARELSRGVVYLAPGSRAGGRSQIALTEADADADLAANPGADDELATVPKGSL